MTTFEILLALAVLVGFIVIKLTAKATTEENGAASKAPPVQPEVLPVRSPDPVARTPVRTPDPTPIPDPVKPPTPEPIKPPISEFTAPPLPSEDPPQIPPPRRRRAAAIPPARPPADTDTSEYFVRFGSGDVAPWSRNLAGKETPAGCLIAAFVDSETTGFAMVDELIEIALILVAIRPDGEIAGVLDAYTGLREPTVAMNPFAARAHKITHEELSGQVLDLLYIENLIQRAEFLIAHNAPFDKRFVCRVLPGAAQKEWVCSKEGIDWEGHGCESRSLKDLLKHHGISLRHQSHRAMVDSWATITLLQMRSSHGLLYLHELLELRAKRAAPPPVKKAKKSRGKAASEDL